MSDYTVIIGLEVHTQLKTKSKLFCGCANEFNPDNPNTQTCPVCLGLPGALPVMNRRAFDLSVKTALALNCNIPLFTKWDRKQYYYPDLPKAYQISQYDLPFSEKGWLEIANDEEGGPVRRINITRAHLEEDAGKNIHDESGRGGDSCVDLNRTGTPLLEIVSEPDLRSASEARRYLEDLRTLLLFIGVSDCNMQEGSLRCDANVNLHIHNADVFARLIREGDLGFSEAYLDEWWSTPDLQAFMDLAHAGNDTLYDGFPGMAAVRLYEKLRFWLQGNSKNQAR